MNLLEFPSPPIAVVNFSPPPALSITLHSVPVSVLPPGFIPIVPLFAGAVASGSGSGAVAVAAAITPGMSAWGTGGMQVSARGKVAAIASGSGKLTAPAYVVGQAFPTSIESEGAGISKVASIAGTASNVTSIGSATVAPQPATQVSASATGTSIVMPTASIRAAASGAGTPTVTSAVSTTASAVGTGTSTVTPVTFTSAGMTKTGTQQVPDTFTKLTGWVTRSGYPAGPQSDAIVIPALTVSYTAAVAFVGAANAGRPMYVQLRAGATVLGEVNIANASNTATFSGSYTATTETQLTLWARSTSSLNSRDVVAETGTYLTASI